jgi:DNA helicase-2/ATP-dependent DNA helicase PcrA
LLSWLRFHKATMIGEVIPILHRYLRSNPAADERREFAHILVDEYQDLNRAEQAVVDLLADDADICIVGDDDQSIYSFKHAHPEGIREWLVTNIGASDLTLTQCRRCPTRVVNMANNLIARNTTRPVPRSLLPRAENGTGDVRILQFATLAAEVVGVANLAKALVDGGTPAGEILILAQRKIIGTPVYEALVARGLPARSYYADAELDHEDAQRRFALLKLLVDRDDRVALRWLLGYGSNSWMKGGYFRLRAHCESQGADPWPTLEGLAAGQIVLPHTGALITKFRQVRAEIDSLDALGDLFDIVDSLFPGGTPSVRDIRALAIETLTLNPDLNRAELLSALVGLIAKPEVPTEIEDIRVMSLHKSKGLSASVTIICGCVEGLLPMQPESSLPAPVQQAQLEEQRRLFYVGITRVKADPAAGRPGTLILTYSAHMPIADVLGAGMRPAGTRFGVAQLHASRFIAEMGAAAPRPILG